MNPDEAGRQVDQHWRRLHPASPVVKSWQAVVGVVAVGYQDAFRQRLDVAGGLVVAVIVVTAVYGWLAWRATRYALLGTDLVLESGVLFKRSRRVPLARLQAVDVVRPLLARALGLAELKLEVAGGKSSDATLAYLAEPAAAVVRNELLVLAAGLRDDVAAVPAPEEAEETVVAHTPAGLLVVVTLLSTPMLIFLTILGVAGVVAVVTGEPALFVGAFFSTTFAFGAQVWAQFAREYGTTVAAAPDGLRLRRGLVETRSQTVPPGRVQGIVLREPTVWRAFGWVRIETTVAGYGQSAGSISTTLLPVARREVGYDLIARVLPGVAWQDVPLEPAPRAARVRAPIEGGRLGIGIGNEGGEAVAVTRRGRFGQRTDVVPLARAQSVRLVQGPLQRALGLATVAIDVSPGQVRAKGLHRDALDGRAFVDRLVADARAARAAALPDRWLRGGHLGSDALDGGGGDLDEHGA